MRSCLILCILAGLESFGNFPYCCSEEEGAILFRSALFISIIFAAALAPKINADADSPSGRAFGQLVLAVGIDHPDQVIDFDYSTGTCCTC